jgi:hypothetical protein
LGTCSVILLFMIQSQMVKQLRLITPRKAEKLGVRAEAPVFISPRTDKRRQCTLCPVVYTPIVYQTGQVTTAQHWHENEGGIYLYVINNAKFLEALCNQSGWIAQVETIGQIAINGSPTNLQGRAEAVRCLAISAWCQHQHTEKAYRNIRGHPPHLITEGLIASDDTYDWPDSELLPVCAKTNLPKYRRTPFAFHVRDGFVFFQMQE